MPVSPALSGDRLRRTGSGEGRYETESQSLRTLTGLTMERFAVIASEGSRSNLLYKRLEIIAHTHRWRHHVGLRVYPVGVYPAVRYFRRPGAIAGGRTDAAESSFRTQGADRRCGSGRRAERAVGRVQQQQEASGSAELERGGRQFVCSG